MTAMTFKKMRPAVSRRVLIISLLIVGVSFLLDKYPLGGEVSNCALNPLSCSAGVLSLFV